MKLIVLDRLVELKEHPTHERVLQVRCYVARVGSSCIHVSKANDAGAEKNAVLTFLNNHLRHKKCSEKEPQRQKEQVLVCSAHLVPPPCFQRWALVWLHSAAALLDGTKTFTLTLNKHLVPH